MALLPLLGCQVNAGKTLSPKNPWPTLLDEHADYRGTGAAEGDRLLTFLLPDQAGSQTDYRQFLGFVVAIEIGALWCAPCRDAAEVQQALHDSFQPEPVWAMTVLMQDETGGPPDPADAAAWAQQFGLEVPVLADLFQEQQQGWTITTWPTTLIVGPDGTVLHRHDGIVEESVLVQQIDQALLDHADALRRP